MSTLLSSDNIPALALCQRPPLAVDVGLCRHGMAAHVFVTVGYSADPTWTFFSGSDDAVRIFPRYSFAHVAYFFDRLQLFHVFPLHSVLCK